MIKVKELIEQLEKIEDKELEVRMFNNGKCSDINGCAGVTVYDVTNDMLLGGEYVFDPYEKHIVLLR